MQIGTELFSKGKYGVRRPYGKSLSIVDED
jgi:hypothetical protein